ncbi:MAG: type II 3-dehydroquinate dehydratase [Candidatus Geothermincolia bacterium]
MFRIVIINGPNLNLLGERDPSIYGSRTLDDINSDIAVRARELNVQVVFFQSNHEGALIDKIHAERKEADGFIINPGALTHYSFSLRDALEAVAVPAVEIHLSDISQREEFRRVSVISPVVWKTIMGKGPDGYLQALESLVEHLSE